MKKYTSAAALALRLTWVRVTALFALVGAAQWIAFIMNFEQTWALEYQLDDTPAWIGRMGVIALTLVLYFTLERGKGSKTAYTLRRLSLSEDAVTAVWAFTFAGYFVMYWVFQIGMVLGMYFRYVAQTGGSENLLFLACYRSAYFHYLLPLAEPWGYARNIAAALGFGSTAALSAQNARNGRWNPLCMGLLIMFGCTVLMPFEMASMGQDIATVVVVVLCTAIDWIWTGRWMRNEAN